MRPRSNPLRQKPDIMTRIRTLVAANPAACGNDALVCIVAEEFHLAVTPGQVAAALWKEGIRRTGRLKSVRRERVAKPLLPIVDIVCSQCHATFRGKRQLYCSVRCRLANHTQVRAARRRKAREAVSLPRAVNPPERAPTEPAAVPAVAARPIKPPPVVGLTWEDEAREQQRRRQDMLRFALRR